MTDIGQIKIFTRIHTNMKYLSFSLFICLSLLSSMTFAQEEEYGLASYYSDDFEGRSTAYGDTYNKEELTCAHKRFPYGTMLKVTRLDNKKSVTVKVIDKGPFIKGRVVDLSRRAAEVLGIVGMGSVEVKVEKVGNSTSRPSANAEEIVTAPAATPRSFEEPAPERIVTTPAAEPRATSPAPAPEKLVERTAEPTTKPAATAPAAKPATTTPTVNASKDRFSPVGKDYNPYGLYRIVLEKPNSQTGFGVQVASFTSYENVMQRVADLQAQWFDNILISIEPGEGGKSSYKVILGPFDDQKTAQHYQASLASRYKIRGFVIDLAGLKY
jgi:rare lipoprotein A